MPRLATDGCLATLLAGAALVAASRPCPAASRGDLEQSVARVLAEIRAGGVEAPSKELHALGPDTIGVLLGGYLLGRVESGRPSAEPAAVILDQRARSAVLGALELHGREPVVPLLAGLLQGRPEVAPRAAGLAILERLGNAGDLSLVLDLATLPGTGAGDAPVLLDPLGPALQGILARDPEALGRIGIRIGQSDPLVARALARAAAASGDPQAFTVLGWRVGRDPEVDLILMPCLGRAAEQAPRPLDPYVLQAVRDRLAGTDPTLARCAVLTSGALGDTEAVADLIELLEGDDPQLGGAAHWALKELTRLGFDEQPARWRTWYEEECRWRDQELPRIQVALASSLAAEAVAALQELSTHRLWRDELALSAAEALHHAAVEVRMLACRVQVSLGSTAALPALIARLEDPEPRVSEAAHQALGELTSLELPPEPKAWARSLPGHASRR